MPHHTWLLPRQGCKPGRCVCQAPHGQLNSISSPFHPTPCLKDACSSDLAPHILIFPSLRMRPGDLLNSKFTQTSFGDLPISLTPRKETQSCVLTFWNHGVSCPLNSNATWEMGAFKSPVSLALPLGAEVLLVDLNPFISELAEGMEHVLGRDHDPSGTETSVLLSLSLVRHQA